MGRLAMWPAVALVAANLAMVMPVRAATVSAGDGVRLAPHKATYSMRLGRVRSGGDVAGVKGSMTMEIAKSCSGWTQKHRFLLTMINNEGNRIETDTNFSSFESLDGLTYRFTARTTRNGGVTDDIQGNATLEAPGGAGTADFTRPKGTRFDLPKGTLFPTKHLEALIGAARRGESRIFRIVFDGQSKEGAYEVNAILTGFQAKASAEAVKRRLTDRPSWYMRLAFFPKASSKAEPQHEAGLRIFDNGVADDIEWDWGSFTVKGRLKSIEALPEPKC